MKRIIILLLISLSFVFNIDCQTLFAQTVTEAMLSDKYDGEVDEDGIQWISMSDPQYEWDQVDDKKIKIELTEEGMKFNCKDESLTALSTIELPIDEERDHFTFGFKFKGIKLDDKRFVGLVFNYEDNLNYQGLGLYKKQCSYFKMKDGKLSTIKTGLIKYKNNSFTLLMTRNTKGVSFKFNDLDDICHLKSIKIDSPYFGIFMSGKSSMTVPAFTFSVERQDDSEASTSDI